MLEQGIAVGCHRFDLGRERGMWQVGGGGVGGGQVRGMLGYGRVLL